MNNRLKLFISCSLLLSVSFSSHRKVNSSSKNSIGIQTGYNRGFSILGNFTIYNIAEGLPGNIRFGIGYNE